MQPSNSIKRRLSRKRFFRLPKKLAAQRIGKQRLPRTTSPRSIVTWANTQKLNRFTSARSKYSKRNSALSKRRKAWPRALYDRMGQYAKAEPLELRALRIYENALGPDHPDPARANINLAHLYCDKGEFAKAELLAIRELKVGEKKLGAEHLDTAKDLIVLANLYRDTAQYTKAEPLYQRALKIREKSLGPNHTTVATTLDELAALYSEKGQSAKAEPFSQCAAGIRARIKEERPPTATKSPATQTN